MTLPGERYRALRQLPTALTDLALAPGPVGKRELREIVRRLLRHYPLVPEIDRMAKASPDLLRRVP